jgi:hypothetical protein
MVDCRWHCGDGEVLSNKQRTFWNRQASHALFNGSRAVGLVSVALSALSAMSIQCNVFRSSPAELSTQSSRTRKVSDVA